MIKKPSEMINIENKFRVLIAGYPRNRKNNIRVVSAKTIVNRYGFWSK